jgi:hypothetical protein
MKRTRYKGRISLGDLDVLKKYNIHSNFYVSAMKANYTCGGHVLVLMSRANSDLEFGISMSEYRASDRRYVDKCNVGKE